MRSLSATEKLIPSPWLPSRKVVSYISTSGFINPAQAGKIVIRQIALACKLELNAFMVLAMEHSPGFLKIVNEARANVREISIEQARERLAQNPKTVLLDVREDIEWQKGHAAEARHLGK